MKQLTADIEQHEKNRAEAEECMAKEMERLKKVNAEHDRRWAAMPIRSNPRNDSLMDVCIQSWHKVVLLAQHERSKEELLGEQRLNEQLRGKLLASMRGTAITRDETQLKDVTAAWMTGAMIGKTACQCEKTKKGTASLIANFSKLLISQSVSS